MLKKIIDFFKRFFGIAKQIENRVESKIEKEKNVIFFEKSGHQNHQQPDPKMSPKAQNMIEINH